jgi:hypothetical protein
MAEVARYCQGAQCTGVQMLLLRERCYAYGFLSGYTGANMIRTKLSILKWIVIQMRTMSQGET